MVDTAIFLGAGASSIILKNSAVEPRTWFETSRESINS